MVLGLLKSKLRGGVAKTIELQGLNESSDAALHVHLQKTGSEPSICKKLQICEFTKDNHSKL